MKFANNREVWIGKSKLKTKKKLIGNLLITCNYKRKNYGVKVNKVF